MKLIGDDHMLNTEMVNTNISNISDYLAERQFRDIHEVDQFVFTYGPYIATNRNQWKWLVDKLGAFNPYMALMNMGAGILKVLCSPMRIGEIKHHLVSLTRQVNQNPITNDEIRNIASNLCNNTIRHVKEHQRNILALESTTVNMIEDQPGVISPKPYPVDPLNARFFKNLIMDEESSYENEDLQKICADILKDFLLPILMCANTYTLDINMYLIEGLADSTEFLTMHNPLLDPSEINNPGGPMVQAYYFMAGLQYIPDPNGRSKVLTFLDTYIKACDGLVSESFMDIVNAAKEYTPADESYLEGEAEQELRDASDEKIVKALDKTNFEMRHLDKTTNIDKITAYIFTHRNIHCNELANTLFLSENDIDLDGYTIVNDTILIAFMDKDRTMVCPFNDMADDRKLKLLILSNGNTSEIRIKPGLKYLE